MIFMASLMTGISIVSSVSPLAAAAYGAEQPRKVGQVMQQGLWLALLIALPLVLAMANLSDWMRSLGQDPAIVPLVDSYLQLARWGLLPALGFAVLRCTVTALSNARPILVIMLIANLFNVLGNYVLAFGKWGFPEFGLAGLAIASSLSHLIMFVSLLGYVLCHRDRRFRPYRLFERCYRLQPKILRQLLWLGFPIGIVTILENGLFTVMTLMVGAIGTHVLAAQQLALQTVVIVFMLPLAPILMFEGMIAGALLAFTLSLDDFVITFFTSGPDTVTFPVLVYSMVRFSVTPEINAASTVLIVITAAVTVLAMSVQSPARRPEA